MTVPKDRGIPLSAPEAWDMHTLPDWDNDFSDEEGVRAFAEALSVPGPSPSEDGPSPVFITALNDWRPINQNVRVSKSIKRKKQPDRGKDETRQGITYHLFKYPFLFLVTSWLILLSGMYLLTRLYIYLYERYISWTGHRRLLRENLRKQENYAGWVDAAKSLDTHLGSDKWKSEDEYAYYDSAMIRRATESMKRARRQAEKEEKYAGANIVGRPRGIDELKTLAESCVKDNFSGFENPRLYSETYYGTKDLVQEYVDEAHSSLEVLFNSEQLSRDQKRNLAKHISTNFGRTALCLSGGACFAYYHFGIAKALLDRDLLPKIITGTSGGALVAALLTTKTEEELRRCLVPALAYRITACHDSFTTWFRRFLKTGARFDSVDWARRMGWFCHGSLTFLEAYQRTGRILNISCIPSDPHTPTMLVNYQTAPDCVIWSAVLASAAVPGVQNPVVLMRKNFHTGVIEPYSFGHKWKDGSLRTDIPLKALNLQFNVNFSIVSQVNPHINLFFFSSRGAVGRPVSHRKGRGWRGGFIGSAIEQFIKLDLKKWLKVLRHLELLPRWLGQDWSEVWLQRFSGTITVWPKSKMIDFWYILSDPTPERLAGLMRVGQLAAWPKVKFIANRMAIEKLVDDARAKYRSGGANSALPTPKPENGLQMSNMFSEEDLQDLLKAARSQGGQVEIPTSHPTGLSVPDDNDVTLGTGPRRRRGEVSPSFSKKLSSMFYGNRSSPATKESKQTSQLNAQGWPSQRRGSAMDEIRRQSRVFFDDTPLDTEAEHEDTEAESEGRTDDEGLRFDKRNLRAGLGKRTGTDTTDFSEESTLQDSDLDTPGLQSAKAGTFIG
ncbi:patatin-domain-containing protein [Polychaeton citri CBS 116435]|uniref:Patatin-like phospholipase domain-containing protein n=1 Tax=Polychaeton citri CBS 116435 TaxID=1314669 RepID=A0A9P4PZV0_9PEZI|nr:patatin-domain-containing protein [Polychaeton citri CBS 116435]